MLSALKKLLWGTINPVKQTSSLLGAGGVYSHLQDLEDADIPRYPPFAKGLPATPIDKLLATQRQLISKIHYSLGFSQDDAQRLLFPVIRNYAAFVHLLPASEAHHHRGAGGLFRHGLEVAFWATQASEAIIFEPEGSPEEKIEKEPRWRFGVFLGALMHDLGKPLSDLVVTDKPGVIEWNPYAETLEEWLNESGVTHYFLRWNKGRHQRHERLATLALNMVMTPDVKRYLRLPGPELMKTLIEAISGTSALHPMAKLIMLADAESVKRDLKESRLNIDGNSLGVSIEPYIIDAIRSLVQSGRWKCNQMDAQVWHVSQGTFIAWKQAVPSLVQKLKDNSVPAVPHDPDTLADYLIDRGFALSRPIPGREDEADENYYRYWEVTVSVEAEEGLIVEPKILMLRMEDAFLVFGNSSNPPEAIPAKIPGLDQNGQLVIQGAVDGAPEEEPEEETQGSSDAAESEEGGDKEHLPSSVRERLLSFSPVKGDATEDAMSVLSLLSVGGKGVDSATVNKPSTEECNTDNTPITDKETLPVDPLSIELPAFSEDSAHSIDVTNSLSFVTPPPRVKTTPSAHKQPKSKGEETDIDALLAAPQRSKTSKNGAEESSAVNADTSTNLFADLMGGSKPTAEVSQKTVTKKKEMQKAPALEPPEVEAQAVVSKSRTSATAPSPTPLQTPVATPPLSSGESEGEGEDIDFLSALSEISNAMGSDMGMDLPFDLPEPMASSTDEDDGIEYETLDTSSDDDHPVEKVSQPSSVANVSQEAPNSIVTNENVTTPSPSTLPEKPLTLLPNEEVTLTKSSIADTSAKSSTQKKGQKKRKKAVNTQAEKVDATPDMFATPNANDKLEPETILDSVATKDSKTEDDDWLKSLTGKVPAKKSASPTSTLVASEIDFDFLMCDGAKKKRKASAGTSRAVKSPARAQKPKISQTPASVEASEEEETVEQTGSNPETAGDEQLSSPFDIGMPDFDTFQLEPAPITQEDVNCASLSTEVNTDTGQDNVAPSSIELPPIESYGDMPDSDDCTVSYEDKFYDLADHSAVPIEATREATREALVEPKPSVQQLPGSTGDAGDKELANHYLTDVLTPILKGYGYLGQVLLREPTGQLVLLVEPAAKLLKIETAALVTALAKGGVILPGPLMMTADRLMFSTKTEHWIEQLLRESETERMRSMEQDESFDNEKPSTSLVRRKHRTKGDVHDPVNETDSSSLQTQLTTPTFDESSVLSTRNDDVENSNMDTDDGIETQEIVPSPKSSLTAYEALVVLREMIIAGEGEWLVGSVTKETDGYSTSDLCIEKVIKANPELSRRELRNALKLSKDLKMNVVAEQKRFYVKD